MFELAAAKVGLDFVLILLVIDRFMYYQLIGYL